MEHQQKNLSHLADFGQKRGWKGGGGVEGKGRVGESIKKGKSVTKIFFQKMLNEQNLLAKSMMKVICQKSLA